MPVSRFAPLPFRPWGWNHRWPCLFWLVSLTFAITLSGLAQQVVTIAPSSGVAPAEIYSGTNYSGIHSNGVTISSSGGTDQIDLQVTNLPAGATVYLQSSFVPPTSSSTSFNFLFGVAVTNVAEGDYTLYLLASSTNPSIVAKTRTFGLHVGSRTFCRPSVTNNTAWSANTNWSPTLAGGLAPGANVVFEDQAVEIGGTNSVTANTTIGRLSYLRVPNNALWRTVLSSGVTLTVTNGFSANNVTADNS